MREAAAKLVGTKDYRNFCKIDASKQMTSCVRRVSYAGIEEWSASGRDLTRNKHLNADGMYGMASMARRMGIGNFVDEGPKVYGFHSAWERFPLASGSVHGWRAVSRWPGTGANKCC